MSSLLKKGLRWSTQVRKLLYQRRLGQTLNRRYVTASPTPQNAIDIFKGEWRSRLPEPLAHLNVGELALFEDSRIQWFIETIGQLEGLTVLELGPLEGAHSYMLEKCSAESIISIEANTQAYLKCLIVKELLGLKRVRFLCGNFVEYLRETQTPTFDLCLASGVLYHLQNPAEVIALLARRCLKSLFLWTHYYDEMLVSKNPEVARRHTGRVEAVYEGFQHSLYRYEYQEARYMFGFSGAGTTYSHWMSRDDILRCLKHFGFVDFQIGFDEPEHPHGPAFALIAKQ